MATPIPRNRAAFTLAEVAAATGGVVREADDAQRVVGVSTDTRTIEPGALFVALVGDTHDGHAHVDAARERGAAAAVVRQGAHVRGPRVEVDDTLVALGKLARAHADRVRALRPVPSVAITGSAGKTTTKELTAAVVRALLGEALVTAGNLNNQVGVPMTLLTLDETHRAMVIECGTNARGEIARLGAIVAPEVSVVLNADAGHTQGLGTVQDVAEEKGALFAAATRAAVANADDAPSFGQRHRARVPVLTFGEAPSASVRLLARTPSADGTAQLEIALHPNLVAPRVEPSMALPFALLGRAPALDACAAIAAVVALRGAPVGERELRAMEQALASVKPVPGRLSPRVLAGALVLDDTYNANPRSVRASLEAAGELARGTGGRLVVVLGDMLELGALSARLHAEVGEAVVRAEAAVFIAVGREMAVGARVAARAQRPVVVETERTDDAATVVASVLRPGDVVLVKGSRGMAMERVLVGLEGARGRGAQGREERG